MTAFSDHFTPDEWRDILAVSEVMDVPKGTILIRRDEPGGDLFWLLSGRLDIVDRRRTPETLFDVVDAGSIVGEMSFVDYQPRSADVRAAEPSVAHFWEREDLDNLFRKRPDLGVAMYRAIARVASARTRMANDGNKARATIDADNETSKAIRISKDSRALADEFKQRLRRVENTLREKPKSVATRNELRAMLTDLRDSCHDLFVTLDNPESRETAANLIKEELHPYLVRSNFADRCIRRHQKASATSEIIAWAMNAKAVGEGEMGILLDEWLLSQPTIRGMRSLHVATLDAAVTKVPVHRNRRVLLLNAGSGSMVTKLATRLGEHPTVLTVVDQTREAFTYHDGSIDDATKVIIQIVQERFVAFAEGRMRHSFPRQDAIIVQGLAEYMPDRMVVALLQAVYKLLAPGGCMILSAFEHSSDATFLDRVLNWPILRRSPDSLVRLLIAAGFEVDERVTYQGLEAPALLLVGTKPETLSTSNNRRQRLASRRSAL